jgi:signal transduction histidine kinase
VQVLVSLAACMGLPASALWLSLETGQTPYFLLFPAVIIATWYGGRVAGLISVGVALAFVDYYILPPLYSFVDKRWPDVLLLVTFGLVSVIVSLLTAGRREADAARHQALREAEQARLEAEQSSRLKDHFLATLSHELRTPLNAVLGWAHMLASGQVEEDRVPAAVATIERNAQAQKQLVDDLLDTSAIMTGRLRLQEHAIDLAEVARSAVDAVRLALDTRRQTLVEALQPAHIVGDPDRLRQVVWNLLSNAAKFTPDGGQIQLRVERAQNQARLQVIDSGRGISPDFLPYVFDPFRQADTSSTRTSGGVGLGLALVRLIVEAHGGTVSVASGGIGRGATFTIALPLRGVNEPVPVSAETPLVVRVD